MYDIIIKNGTIVGGTGSLEEKMEHFRVLYENM